MMTREEASTHLFDDWYIENGRLCVDESNRDDFCKALGAGIKALRHVSREQVEKVWRGEWTTDGVCRKCGFDAMYYDGLPAQVHTNFCPHCGAPMTDEAVEMVMERLNKLEETKK